MKEGRNKKMKINLFQSENFISFAPEFSALMICGFEKTYFFKIKAF
jgi:hypothetical protein